ncbi:MAG: hypothetical protein KDA58_02110 [Planctomycetaceae bacterium]|nr:hypothetical protein [Planctomycetaceae bacterium]
MDASNFLRLLTTTIQQYWSAQFSVPVPTHFPGVPTPLQQHAAWVELWVDALHTPPQRTHAPQRDEVLVTIHCFSRHPQDKFQGQTLAGNAASLFHHRTLPVVESVPDGEPRQVATVIFLEPQIRDLTRSTEPTQPQLQHLVVSVQGVAHRCP